MREVSKEVHFRDRLVTTFVKRDTNFWYAFEKNVKKNPANIAVIDDGVRISYKEIYNLAINQSCHFIQLGIKEGDRVCVLFENSWPLLIYILAGLKDGIIIVPLNPKSSIVENETIINDCTPNSISVSYTHLTLPTIYSV